MPLRKNNKKRIAAIVVFAMLIAILQSAVFALNGTASYKPAESNIAVKYWVTATAGSNTEDAGNAVDGNLNTAWVAAKNGAKWFMLDLGGEYDAVRKAEIVFFDATVVNKYILEGSSDGDTWSLLADRSENSDYVGGFTDVFKASGLRFLKVSFVGFGNPGIKEFRVFNYLRDDMNNGADIGSLVTTATYYNASNNPAAPLMPDGSRAYRGGTANAGSMDTGANFYGLANDLGWKTIRLRVWNEPRSEGGWATPGVWDLAQGISASFPTSNASGGSSPSTVRTHARYIVGAGMDLAIDFHYADSWADPQNQPKPYAWVNLPWDDPEEPLRIPDMTVAAATRPATYDPTNDAQHKIITRGLVSEVEYFTYEMIKSLIDQGTPPTIVALGNEITHGMMWGKEYRLTNHYSATETYNDHHDYYHRFIRDDTKSVLAGSGTYAQRYAASTVVDREDMPYGGGVEWMSYERANGDKNSEEYKSFQESVRRLSILIDAGQRAIQRLNEEYDLSIQTELHFANNVFAEPRGGSKTMLDADDAFERFLTLVDEINKNMVTMSGMVDRIGISYYPDWHGPYWMLERNIVELSKIVPGVKFNIAECSPTASGTTSNWMDNPNKVSGTPTNPNPWVSGLPTSFTYTIQSQGDDTISIMKTINDAPGNVGMGVWPWDAQGVYFTGGQPRASMLAFSQAFASNAVESGVYVTTKVGEAPTLPTTIDDIDPKTGVIQHSTISWGDVTSSQYAAVGTFEVAGTVNTSGNMKDATAYVTVADFVAKPAIEIGRVNAIEDGSTAVFTVNNLYGDAPISAIGFAAVYTAAGALADVKTVDVTVGAGETVTQIIDLDTFPANYTSKVFLWDAVTFAPLCEAN